MFMLTINIGDNDAMTRFYVIVFYLLSFEDLKFSFQMNRDPLSVFLKSDYTETIWRITTKLKVWSKGKNVNNFCYQ